MVNYLHKSLNYFIALVWLINGLLCKVLNLVPRHQEIVGRILGEDYSRPLTFAIGLAEIGMAIWVLSGFKSRLNAILQILVVITMNVLEFILVPDLLLWGKFNALFAFLFILIIYVNEYHLKNQVNPHP
ncbi:DoxX-like family protein [Allomuricauda sp. SCSIO 65647]|uniref:DoxX-like family protein n=1 Tax=Allomuricauda sp. SCSIO 65647 TaxID=2908843 RepID=UPI001F240B14|nr:DoxX-like family protein [Muricauda sp. SCSIO 65647]UJH68613.1 DoxX-like family protein [Muricauda sp. SCSIO 65647]